MDAGALEPADAPWPGLDGGSKIRERRGRPDGRQRAISTAADTAMARFVMSPARLPSSMSVRPNT